MNRIIFALLSILMLTSFTERKHQFENDFLAYRSSLENLTRTVEEHGDTTAALEELKFYEKNLSQWADRMAQESASKWDTFETSTWPLPPRNAKCHLECAYQWHLCKTSGNGDWLYCLMIYNDCKRQC